MVRTVDGNMAAGPPRTSEDRNSLELLLGGEARIDGQVTGKGPDVEPGFMIGDDDERPVQRQILHTPDLNGDTCQLEYRPRPSARHRITRSAKRLRVPGKGEEQDLHGVPECEEAPDAENPSRPQHDRRLLALEGRKVVEPPGDTVLTVGRIKDSDPCALLHMAHACQSDPESLSKLVGPAPGHIRR